MSSHILRIMPEHTFDVHVLRTFKRNLIAVLDQLQASLPRPNEAIRQVIFMLNQAFQEVELLYLVWRHDRVQNTLQHGFQYARARVMAAVWRRDHGGNPAAFPGILPILQSSANVPSQPANYPVDWQANAWRLNTQPPFQGNPYGVPSTPSSPWGAHHAVQQYPGQNTPGRSSDLPAQPQVPAQTGYAPVPAMMATPGSPREYAPPAGPPPNWQPPPPVPGSPPISAEVSRAVTAAISYLEAVNRAINVCIEGNAV